MAIAIEADQLAILDFTYPVSMNPFRMIVPAAQEKSRLFAFTRPFQPWVWLSFFISLIASVTTKSLITWLYKRWEAIVNKQQHQQQHESAALVVINNQQSTKPFTYYLSNYIMYTTAIITAHGTVGCRIH
jgi:hypothetical protein